MQSTPLPTRYARETRTADGYGPPSVLSEALLWKGYRNTAP